MSSLSFSRSAQIHTLSLKSQAFGIMQSNANSISTKSFATTYALEFLLWSRMDEAECFFQCIVQLFTSSICPPAVGLCFLLPLAFYPADFLPPAVPASNYIPENHFMS